MRKVVARHGVSVSIVLDRDSRVTSKFSNGLHKALATKLIDKTWISRVCLEDMLRACILKLKDKWDDYLYLAEFAYNNSFQSSIGWLCLKHYMVGITDHSFVGGKLMNNG